MILAVKDNFDLGVFPRPCPAEKSKPQSAKIDFSGGVTEKEGIC